MTRKNAVPGLPFVVTLLVLFLAGCSSTPNSELITTMTTNADSQQRKLAAETLAGRFGSKSVKYIAEMAPRNQFAAEGLETMTDCFERAGGTTGAIRCLGEVKTERAVYMLWKLLTSPTSGDDETKIEAAKSLGVTGSDGSISGLVSAYKLCPSDAVKTAIRDTLKNQGANAVKPLVSGLVEPGADWIADVLADIGDPAVPVLMEKLKDERREVRFGAAMALVKMKDKNPKAVAPFMAMMANRDLQGMADNYPFFIKLGSPGTEELLVEVIRGYGDKTMCLDYLNCGNQRLDQAGREWASNNGYNVYSAPGTHGGPKWGEGI